MAFAIRFAVEGISAPIELFAHVHVSSLGEAKRWFYHNHYRRGGTLWVRFEEVVAPVSAIDAALGRFPRAAATSFHAFTPN